MNPGIYSNISNADYHGGPGVSKSLLDLVNRSPAHMKAALEASKEGRTPTAAQAIGTAFHALVLEPQEFRRQYTLGLRRSDYPDAVDDKEVLAKMIASLNAKRLPKLATTGAKAEMIERVLAAQSDVDAKVWSAESLEAMKGAELKELIVTLNESREGLLSVTGSTEQLAELLRSNGKPVTLWRDVKAEWERNNGHRTILSDEEFDTVRAMRDSTMAHPRARALLSKKGAAEQSVYWIDRETGVLCRCRPDFLTDDDILVDLKSTEDASRDEFAKSCANYRYHVQHSFYWDGMTAIGRKPRAFVFIAVEKKPPYAVGVYVLSAQSVELGRMEYRADLTVYAECRESGRYPAYSDDVENMDLPAWYMNQRLMKLAA
ncbi:TPA: PD-(D/E)XK nuclease-like domain-containing protein [Burkholderia vietnamiensis]|nr:PD-(D/E)XK nuclease-like domain-containing protein [Burkholderia vietnamiensis]